ncbi:MAG: hypothetical protein MUC82_13970 [Cypionkella sp.]|jgi:hypothetical protein|nr:hypothetical protein [Cypionkella sp.]
MSAPQTNIEKQRRRHAGPLIGMIVLAAAVGIGFVWWLGQEAADSNPGQGSAVQIDGRTGNALEPAPSLDPAQAAPPGAPAD